MSAIFDTTTQTQVTCDQPFTDLMNRLPKFTTKQLELENTPAHLLYEKIKNFMSQGLAAIAGTDKDQNSFIAMRIEITNMYA
ncbi:MAG: hypothetical protein K1000chlam2_00753, partial [Chlamydiae bacterium]|nr:hypothetical protein [Chlamydiota bacterium]